MNFNTWTQKFEPVCPMLLSYCVFWVTMGIKKKQKKSNKICLEKILFDFIYFFSFKLPCDLA